MKNVNKLPFGYCQCGCGRKTRIAKWTDRFHGHIGGQPLRFIQNHATRVMGQETKRKISETLKGHEVSEETRKKISNANKGNKWSNEHRQKLLGKSPTKEVRKKLSIANWKGGKKASRQREKNKDNYCLNRRISSRIRQTLIKKEGNKNNRHWEDMVGYSVADLKNRLIKTMPLGYNWEDYVSGRLHIDHIIPISAFNFSDFTHIDFKKCWALENLQLLTAKENLQKHNKLKISFQPSLGF